MTIKRTALIALTTTLGTIALASPASAASYHFTPAWPAKHYATAEVDTSADTDGRDFLIWQRSAG